MRRWCNPLSEMVGLAVCPFLGVVLLLWALGTQAAIAPYATYEQVFQYSDGSISTNQTAQFVLSDAESGGLLQVGDHTLQIQSLPPKLRYRSREVARIPKSVTLHTEEVYLSTGDGQLDISQTERVSQPARRLLSLVSENSGLDVRMADQVEYDQYQYITRRCPDINLFDDIYVVAAFYSGTSYAAQEYVTARFRELAADPSTLISQSAYMRKVYSYRLQPPPSQGNLHVPMLEWADFARFTLNALWVKRSLLPHEDTILRATECLRFPGHCFTSDVSAGRYVSTLSNSAYANCQAYKKNAIIQTLNYERTTAFNIAKGLADPISALYAANLKALTNALNAQVGTNMANSLWAMSVGITLKSVNQSLYAQGAINAQVQELIEGQLGVNAKFASVDGQINDALSLIYSTSQETTNQLLSALEDESNRVDLINDINNNSTNFKFALLIEAMKNISRADDGKFGQLYRGIQDVSDLLQSTAAQLTSYVQQKQFNRLLTRQFYLSSDELLASGSEEVPLVSGTGFRPTQLTGSKLKALIDTVIITSGQSSIHAVRFDFFADTHVMLNASRPWTTIEQLILWMGVSPCVIRASTNSSDAVIVGINYCTLWAEVQIMDCVSGYQPGENSCLGPSVQTNETMTNATSMLSFFSALCGQSLSFNVTSVALSAQSMVLPSADSCVSSFSDKMISGDRAHDLLVVALTYLWTSYMQSFQVTLQSLELIAYGQLPNGVHTETTSMGYSPGPLSGVDGSRVNLQGMRAYWLSVHPETLPVTSLSFLSDSTKDEDVVVGIATSPDCVSNGNTTSPCYSVANSDLRVNWVFRDQVGISLPSQLVVIGDVTSPSFSAIYDAPLSLLQTTSNTLVRENLLTYLMMPVGTERTNDFSFFEQVSVGLFNAKTGSASAEDYRFPAAFDQDGYPVCNIDGGLPVSATYVAPVNKCVPPFVWSGPIEYGSPPPTSGACVLNSRNSTKLNDTVLLYDEITGGVHQESNFSFKWTTGVEFSLSFWVATPPAPPTGLIPPDQVGTPAEADAMIALVRDASFVMWEGTLSLDEGAVNVQLVWGCCFSVYDSVRYLFGECDDGQFRLRFCWHGRVWGSPGEDVGSLTLDETDVYEGVGDPPDNPSQTRKSAFQGREFTSVVVTFGQEDLIGYVNGDAYHSTQSVPELLKLYSPTSSWSFISGTMNSTVFSATIPPLLVKSLQIYAWAIPRLDVPTLVTCGEMILHPRCWIPSINSTANSSFIATSNDIADRGVSAIFIQSQRSSCLSGSSLLLGVHDQPESAVVSFVLPVSFTIAFWMRRLLDIGSVLYSHSDVHVTQETVFVDGDNVDILSRITLAVNQTGAPCFAWTFVGPRNMFIPNMGGSYSFPAKQRYWADFARREQLGHAYAISVSGDRADLYVDGVLQISATTGTCSATLTTMLSRPHECPFVDGITGSGYFVYRDRFLAGSLQCTSAELIRIYSTALSAQDIKQAISCERGSYSMGNETSVYRFPASACTLDPNSQGFGYCRHPIMCNGRCSAYSSINAVAGTFTPLQLVCDPGWFPPQCTERCARVDANGECLTQTRVLASSITDLAADAFSPNGLWCLALKYFQVGAVSVNGQSFVDFAYRQYEYITDLTIPSGQIVTVIPSGHCPTVTLQQNGDGSIWVGLTNVYAEYTQLQIRTRSSESCSAPLVCCNDVYPLVVPPYSSKNWNVPTLCSSLEITINLDFGNEKSLCQSMNSTTVASQLSVSSTSPVVANVARSIVVTGNDVLNSLLATNQQIASFQIEFQTVVYKAAMSGIDIRKSLEDAARQLAISPPPTPSDTTSLVNPWDSTKLPEILKNISAAVNASINAIGDQGDELVNLVTLNTRFTALSVELDTAVSQQQLALEVFQTTVNASNRVILDSIEDMKQALIDFHEAIVVDNEKRDTVINNNSIPTVALVFLTMGSVMGTLAACWVAWPYAKDFYHSGSGWFLDQFGMRRVRVRDMQSEDEIANFADESDVNPEFPSPQPQMQSNITARVSHEAKRMTQPHLYK